MIPFSDYEWPSPSLYVQDYNLEWVLFETDYMICNYLQHTYRNATGMDIEALFNFVAYKRYVLRAKVRK